MRRLVRKLFGMFEFQASGALLIFVAMCAKLTYPLWYSLQRACLWKRIFAEPLTATGAAIRRAGILQFCETSFAVWVRLILPFCCSEIVFESQQSTRAVAHFLWCESVFNLLPIDGFASQMLQQRGGPFWWTFFDFGLFEWPEDEDVGSSSNACHGNIACNSAYAAAELQINDGRW